MNILSSFSFYLLLLSPSSLYFTKFYEERRTMFRAIKVKATQRATVNLTDRLVFAICRARWFSFFSFFFFFLSVRVILLLIHRISFFATIRCFTMIEIPTRSIESDSSSINFLIRGFVVSVTNCHGFVTINTT